MLNDYSYETGLGSIPVDPSTVPFAYETGIGFVAKIRRAAPRATIAAKIDPTAIVTILVANPKKIGSAAHDRFALYVDGRSVTESLKAGVLSADVRYDLSRDYIRIDPIN